MFIPTLLLFLVVLRNMSKKSALATFDGRNNIQGYVKFHQQHDGVLITAKVYNLSDGEHGFHIHTKGDISDMDCKGACDHYNPTGTTHGGLEGGHAGDLGNIESKDGFSLTILKTNKFKLADIIGRTIIIHADKDDLGLADPGDPVRYAESLKTGNAGARIACAIIQ